MMGSTHTALVTRSNATERDIRLEHAVARGHQALKALGHSRWRLTFHMSQKPITVEDVADRLVRDYPLTVSPDTAVQQAQGIIKKVFAEKIRLPNVSAYLGLIGLLHHDDGYYVSLVKLAENPDYPGKARYKFKYSGFAT